MAQLLESAVKRLPLDRDPNDPARWVRGEGDDPRSLIIRGGPGTGRPQGVEYGVVETVDPVGIRFGYISVYQCPVKNRSVVKA